MGAACCIGYGVSLILAFERRQAARAGGLFVRSSLLRHAVDQLPDGPARRTRDPFWTPPAPTRDSSVCLLNLIQLGHAGPSAHPILVPVDITRWNCDRCRTRALAGVPVCLCPWSALRLLRGGLDSNPRCARRHRKCILRPHGALAQRLLGQRLVANPLRLDACSNHDLARCTGSVRNARFGPVMLVSSLGSLLIVCLVGGTIAAFIRWCLREGSGPDQWLEIIATVQNDSFGDALGASVVAIPTAHGLRLRSAANEGPAWQKRFPWEQIEVHDEAGSPIRLSGPFGLVVCNEDGPLKRADISERIQQARSPLAQAQ